MLFSKYTNKTSEESLAELESSLHGLSKKEVSFRQEKYGLNQVKEGGVKVFKIFIKQFKSPFSYLLFIAAAVSFLIGQLIDGLAVLFFVLINVVIGFIQEYRAERSVYLLKNFISEKTRVIRSGKQEFIEKKFLVPGDLVFLEQGDKVGADMRILEAHNFLVDESVLSGESMPLQKTAQALKNQQTEIFRSENIAFEGTLVVSGRAKALVVATGKDAVIGSISKTISEIKRESAYEKNILYFCRLVLKIVVITIGLIFAANILFKGFGVFFEIALFSVALIVSILPEALPAVVTFALSKGALKMAKQKVVVKRLAAIEDLGNIEVLCADKTGTLTQNKLSLEEIVSSDKKKILLYGALSLGAGRNNEKILNPFDLAIYNKVPADIFKKSEKIKIISELPFDSYRMRSSYLAETKPGEKILVVKGAVEAVLQSCSKFSGSFSRSEIKEDAEREGSNGKRILALAFKKVEKNKEEVKASDEKGLTFLGYFVFEDPLKPSAKETIEFAKKLGVQIKIITGDAKETAEFAVRKMGIKVDKETSITGRELEAMLGEDFDDACDRCNVFCRISPDTKYKIIKSLQKKYEVGFLGEGVNDAAALKAANVGIVVEGASDVAREAADVVLLEKNLRVLINGIKDGRMIFSNINKYIKCALASNFGNFYSIAAISVFINFLPMLPVQILLGNILSDFPLISVATDTVDVEELKKPKMYQLQNVLPLIVSLALVSTVFDFVFFAIFYRQQPPVIQTLWFIESILTEILLIFIIRTRGKFWKAKRPGFWLLSLTIIDAIFVVALPFLNMGQTWFHFVAPPFTLLLIVLAEITVYFFVSEFVKLVFFRYWKFSQNK